MLRVALERRLQRLWFRPRGLPDRALTTLLIPLHSLVAIAARRRRAHIAQRKMAPRGARPPVVVVGNLVVGGTGKTPVILALAEALQTRGWHPGILASGYASPAYHAPARCITATDCAHEVGDEAVLLARRSGLPVAVGRNRAASLQALCANTPCTVVIADDGLQHAGLPRDIELAVFDGRGAGNQRCIPAGPLREPLTSAGQMDALLLNGNQTTPPLPHAQVFHFDIVASTLTRLDGQQQWPITEWSAHVSGQRIHALAALGAPQRFFDLLHNLGVSAHGHALADHATIDPAWAASLAADWLIMTEKDAVKCADWPASLCARTGVLRVHATLDPHLIDWLELRLHGKAST